MLVIKRSEGQDRNVYLCKPLNSTLAVQTMYLDCMRQIIEHNGLTRIQDLLNGNNNVVFTDSEFANANLKQKLPIGLYILQTAPHKIQLWEKIQTKTKAGYWKAEVIETIWKLLYHYELVFESETSAIPLVDLRLYANVIINNEIHIQPKPFNIVNDVTDEVPLCNELKSVNDLSKNSDLVKNTEPLMNLDINSDIETNEKPINQNGDNNQREDNIEQPISNDLSDLIKNSNMFTHLESEPKKQEIENETPINPLVIKSLVTKSLVNKSLVTKSLVTKSLVVKPNVNKSPVTKPNVNKSPVNKPNVNKSLVVKPNVTKPNVNKSLVNKSLVAKPNVNKSPVNKSLVNKSQYTMTSKEIPLGKQEAFNKKVEILKSIKQPVLNQKNTKTPLQSNMKYIKSNN